mmetsp:Transcript_48642/g.155382  ORF Transcript_48642/g.155382 Transcript_48642/m.155382 type:complete len:288 (-) Transcript_48642:492-1355(-)
MPREEARGQEFREGEAPVVVQVARAQDLAHVHLGGWVAPPLVAVHVVQCLLQILVGDEAVAVAVCAQEGVAYGLRIGRAHPRRDAQKAATHDSGGPCVAGEAPRDLQRELAECRLVGLQPGLPQRGIRGRPPSRVHLQQGSHEAACPPAPGPPGGQPAEVGLQLLDALAEADALLVRPGELYLAAEELQGRDARGPDVRLGRVAGTPVDLRRHVLRRADVVPHLGRPALRQAEVDELAVWLSPLWRVEDHHVHGLDVPVGDTPEVTVRQGSEQLVYQARHELLWQRV